MSDEKQQPELTPAEQQQQDTERIQGQLIVTDVQRQMQGVMEAFGFGSPGPSGRTSFEGHDLNAMIDLIENSNPEHLEEAGRALLKARTAISDAAKELGDFIAAVDWEGESGVAFRDWGKGLVVHAENLGEFAQAAGTQITVAGTGLASVRNSLPPRDSRLIRKSPDDILSPARVETNPEYAAALKVEKDRQEAINQANRLASYYAVAGESLAGQEPPRFDKKLDVEMPKPSGYVATPGRTGSSSAGSEAVVSGTPQEISGHAVTGGADSTVVGRRGEAERIGTAPAPPVSTEINSVSAPPAPVTTPGPTPTPAVTGPGPAGGGPPTPPMVNGYVKPVTSSSRVPQGTTGTAKTVGQAGSSNARSVSGPAANNHTGPQVGRPSPMTGGSASGTGGRGGGGPQTPAAGRSGVTGGRPTVTGRTAAPGATGPSAGRGGIVGGTPQRAVPGAGAPGGTRGVQRGTVIGAGGAARAGGAVGGVGQRGVVGAGGTGNASRPGGKGTPSTRGVVGTPRGGAAGPGAGGKGFTAGGAGLVRGPAGRKGSGDEEQDDGIPRPDYLTEDRETWEAGRRGSAPPVIE